jgi:hypothetical protein
VTYTDLYGDVYGEAATWPTITVEVAFTTDPADTPVWEDISEWVRHFTTTRGRNAELDQFRPGKATIVLANDDRRFDPTYTAGPYWPDVVPMRRIRIRATWAGTTYDLFSGYVDGWQQNYSHPEVAECVVTATDAFSVLANVELPTSPYAVTVLQDSPVHWWRLGEPNDETTVADFGSDPVPGTYHGTTKGQPGAIALEPDTAVAFNGTSTDWVEFPYQARIQGNVYTVELWLKIGPTTPATDTDYWFISLNRSSGSGEGEPFGRVNITTAGVGTVRWGGLIGTTNINDGAWHHVVLATSPTNTTLWVDANLEDTEATVIPSTSADGVYLGYKTSVFSAFTQGWWPGSIDEVAIYDTTLSAARIGFHNTAGRTPWRGDLTGARIGRLLDAVGWPTADRDVDTGRSTLQSSDLGGIALSALQKVEETEQGRLFVTAAGKVRFISRDNLLKAPYTTVQATFGDDGAELEYADLVYVYDDQLIFNEVVVSRDDGTAQIAKDADSQTRYLRRTRVVDGLLHQSDTVSLDLAHWVLIHYKDPMLRVERMVLEPSAGNQATHFPHVLGRELSERIRVLRRPQQVGSAVDQEVLIEGIEHRVTPDLRWQTTWSLSPAVAQTYWLVGVAGNSEIGETTRVAF